MLFQVPQITNQNKKRSKRMGNWHCMKKALCQALVFYVHAGRGGLRPSAFLPFNLPLPRAVPRFHLQ